MNPYKFSAIAHRDHDYCNPIAAAKVERLLDLLPLDETSRVLDLGCGRAELALRIIERFGATVVAVDRSSLMLDQARERAEWTGALGKLHLDDIDIRDFRAEGAKVLRCLFAEFLELVPEFLELGHLPPAEGMDEVGRLHPDRRRLLAHARPSRLPPCAGCRSQRVSRPSRQRPGGHRRGGLHVVAKMVGDLREVGFVADAEFLRNHDAGFAFGSRGGEARPLLLQIGDGAVDSVVDLVATMQTSNGPSAPSSKDAT